MNNIYKRFLDNYDDCFEDGITRKEFAERLCIPKQMLNGFLEKSGKPAPLLPIEYLASRVKEHITNNGGSIRLALEELGEENAVIKSFSVRKHLREQGFDWRMFGFINLELGCYRGGKVLDGGYDLPYGQRRLEVECLKCGHKHSVSVANFSQGQNQSCAYCPKRPKIHRKHKVLETGETGSLMGLWKEYFSNALPYVSLRQKILRNGFYKDESLGLTLVLLDTDDAFIKASLGKGKSRRPIQRTKTTPLLNRQ